MMQNRFTLEYWVDDGWYVGKLKEVPGVFSQGESPAELEANIRDTYILMMEEGPTPVHPGSQTKRITLELS